MPTTPAKEEQLARQRARALAKARRAAAVARARERTQAARAQARETRRRLKHRRAQVDRLLRAYDELDDLGTERAVQIADRAVAALAAIRRLEDR